MFSTTLKESFKSKGRDKASGEGVYAFAKNFYKVVKDKPPQRVEAVLMNLTSDDENLNTYLSTFSVSGPTASLNGTAEEWHWYPRLCNSRSLFLKPTSYMEDVRDKLLGEKVVYDTFRQVPTMWVGAIWDRLRNVRQEDVRGLGEQFKWVIAYVLEKLDTRVSIVKIWEEFGRWQHDLPLWLNVLAPLLQKIFS
jgi:hypothetical protein